MKIGIFGGSFNPPHKMHLNIGVDLVNKHYVDKIFYVPTGSKYKYKNNLISDNYRLDMLKINTNKYSFLEVSDYELKDFVVYTCDTLSYFRKLYPDDEIYFLCGADNLSYIDKWKNAEYILNNYKILVIKRKGEDIDYLIRKYDEYKHNIVIADIEQCDISSTVIREKIKNNDNLTEYIDDDVYSYILENNLYR